jgi:hypothetical protein
MIKLIGAGTELWSSLVSVAFSHCEHQAAGGLRLLMYERCLDLCTFTSRLGGNNVKIRENVHNLAALNLEDEWLALFAFRQSCFSDVIL